MLMITKKEKIQTIKLISGIINSVNSQLKFYNNNESFAFDTEKELTKKALDSIKKIIIEFNKQQKAERKNIIVELKIYSNKNFSVDFDFNNKK